ncbi:MAG: N4-(beta-N-acetylglucosaminyl)-L-asparaginase [Paraglaciecola sp.]|jgi:N4-(beta-N-acetylglucosaminyl)-L-asparaginase
MFSRRKFLSSTTLGSLGLALGATTTNACANPTDSTTQKITRIKPIVISTWNHGLPANEAAMEILKDGGQAIDAVEQGVRVTEADPEIKSVGLGGLPDREGIVTLDACIMDSEGNAGGVCFLQHIKHPISVARKVMDDTPHVLLAGEGALQFALANGFEKENLLTEASKKAWQEWRKESEYKPIINVENHDTIGMLALDSDGNLAGACTTSGLAYKMHGRVGDSPIIGAGLFVDNEIGAAVATGLGEEVLKTLGSFLIVELMRQGRTPQEACEEGIRRIAKKGKDVSNLQIAYLAISKSGEVGAYGIHSGFNYAIHDGEENKMVDVEAHIK